MVKFPLKFFYNIGVILENLEFPHFCLDFLQKKFYNIDPRAWCYKTFFGGNLDKNRVILEFPKLHQCYKKIWGKILPFSSRFWKKNLRHKVVARFRKSRFPPFFHRDMLMLRNDLYENCKILWTTDF